MRKENKNNQKFIKQKVKILITSSLFLFSFFVYKTTNAIGFEAISFTNTETPTVYDNAMIETTELGDIIICSTGYNTYWKTNTSTTWTSKTASQTHLCDISDNGEKILINNNRYYNYSIDYGNTWSANAEPTNNSGSIQQLSLSDNGEKAIISKFNYYHSTINGFTNINSFYIGTAVDYARALTVNDTQFDINTRGRTYYGTDGVNFTNIDYPTAGDALDQETSKNNRYKCEIKNDYNIRFSNNYNSWDTGYFANANQYRNCRVGDSGIMYLYNNATGTDTNVITLDLNNTSSPAFELLQAPNNKKIEAFNIINETDGEYILCEDGEYCYTYKPEKSGISGYWKGAGGQYCQAGTSCVIPFYYDLCDIWDQEKEYILTLYADDGNNQEYFNSEFYDIKQANTLAGECRGSIDITVNAKKLITAEQGSLRVLEDLDLIWDGAGFWYYIGNSAGYGQETKNIVALMPVSSLINEVYPATTSIPFSYNFTGISDISTSTYTIWIYNDDNHTKTTFNTKEFGTTSGTSSINIANGYYDDIYNLSIILERDNDYSTIIKSNKFKLTFGGQEINENIGTINQIFGTTTSAIVCSAEEWADGNWWTVLKCSTLKTILDIVEKIINGLKTIANTFINILKNVFPFNFIFKVAECWNNSSITGSPTGTDIGTFTDENDNLYITVPKEWNGTATDTDIIVFGEDLFENKATAFFMFTKLLSKFLMWGLFILYLINLAKHKIDELKNEE